MIAASHGRCTGVRKALGGARDSMKTCTHTSTCSYAHPKPNHSNRAGQFVCSRKLPKVFTRARSQVYLHTLPLAEVDKFQTNRRANTGRA